MKKLLPLFFAMSPVVLSAQTTITGAPGLGYTLGIGIASAATATNVPLTTGNGVTWNCSALSTGTTPIVTLLQSTPVGKPYASDYPSANMNMGVSVATTTLANEFQHLSADSLVKYGGHVSGNSYEIYSDPEMMMKFPFSYGNTYSNNYAKTNYNSSGGVTSTQTGNNTLTYDGFGTLILPSGTLTGVGMISNVRTNSIGPTTTSYQWILVSTGEVLMRYDNNGGVKVNYVANVAMTGIKEAKSNEQIAIYPTVTNCFVKVKSAKTLNYYKVYNIAGSLITSESNLNTTELSIDIKAQPGLYFVEIGNTEMNFKKQQKIVLVD